MKYILILIVFINNIYAQDNSEAFHKEVLKYYDFSPSKLSSYEIEKKSEALDLFWKKIENDKTMYLPLLRKELKDYSNPAYFFYDGCMLLESLSGDSSDISIIVNGLPKADINDLDPYYYLAKINHYASRNYDVSEGALRILDYPNFSAYVARHGKMKVDQATAMLFTLIPMREEYFLDKLIQRAAKEKNEVTLKSIVFALWITTTSKGDSIISVIKDFEDSPDEVVEYIEELEEVNEKIISGSESDDGIFKLNLPESANIEYLKQERRKLMESISDETLDVFYLISRKIRQTYYKQGK